MLPFHRAVMESRDFTGEDGFKVHTRWIETDFAARLEAEARPAASFDNTLIRAHVEIDGRRHEVGIPSALLASLGSLPTAAAPASAIAAHDPLSITAPISGTLQAFKVEDGAEVAAGDLVAVVEAMKMETQVTAQQAGTVRFKVEAGSSLQAGAEIARLETPAAITND